MKEKKMFLAKQVHGTRAAAAAEKFTNLSLRLLKLKSKQEKGEISSEKESGEK